METNSSFSNIYIHIYFKLDYKKTLTVGREAFWGVVSQVLGGAGGRCIWDLKIRSSYTQSVTLGATAAGLWGHGPRGALKVKQRKKSMSQQI